jgi:hypothetical protein
MVSMPTTMPTCSSTSSGVRPLRRSRVGGIGARPAGITHPAAAPGGDRSGSGAFAFNPPWNLEIALRPALPTGVEALGQDDQAAFAHEVQQT